jgi:hypothetical protein
MKQTISIKNPRKVKSPERYTYSQAKAKSGVFVLIAPWCYDGDYAIFTRDGCFYVNREAAKHGEYGLCSEDLRGVALRDRDLRFAQVDATITVTFSN